jgi:large repetitive protein
MPVLSGPDPGASLDGLPVFAWNPAGGADRYEFQLSADSGFSSLVADFFTKNTRAALRVPIPNGTYWWRVRASTTAGAVSPWAPAWSFENAWGAAPSPVAPAEGDTIVYPQQPLELSWTRVAGAFAYRVALANDPGLGSLIGGKEFDTQALSFTPAILLAPGTYYWAVTPVDAEGNRGTQSVVSSFSWSWPSETTGWVNDLADPEELFDPQLSWNPVAGAARYEVEVNSSVDFATGSKVCCTKLTLGTSLSPTEVLANNTYYWRVRAKDANGNAGVWNEGEPFVKTFDNAPSISGPSVQNLRMIDRWGSTLTDQASDGSFLADVPIIAWDPVPGAASYQVEVVPYVPEVGLCDSTAASSTRWKSVTATTYWTPLGSGFGGGKPLPSSVNVSSDAAHLVLDQPYCVRVAPRSGRLTVPPVLGDFAYLTAPDQPAFTWTGYPAGGTCSPSCVNGYLGADDYLLPENGVTTTQTPLFTWQALDGKASYFVVVAKDPAFTNIVDYAFTQAPAYAPRAGAAAKTYPDETTSYYWAVFPAVLPNGGIAASNPASAAARNFEKQSIPPTLLAPFEDALVEGPPTFQWTPVFGARRYRLQVDDNPTFASPIDNVLTVSTAYTSSSTYQSDTVLYWRVQADDETPYGLTWSATGSFRKQLPAPVLDPSNPTEGEALPTIQWGGIPGAISYDVHVEEPDGDVKNFNGFPATAASFVKMSGTGIFHWQVRANFPTSTLVNTAGPYSESGAYAKSILPPGSPTVGAGFNRLSFDWSSRPAAKRYRIEVATRPDFATKVEAAMTETTAYTPLLTQAAYIAGGTFYWRVAAVDDGNNVGEFTPVQTFDLPAYRVAQLKQLRLAAIGRPVLRRRVRIVIIVKDNATLAPVAGASVRVSGVGVTRQTKQTSATGRVRFYVRATRLGRVTFRATKPGYATAYLYRSVRRP